MHQRPVLVLLTVLLMNVSSVLAAETKASHADWVARFPILILSILIVIAVDAAFIVPIRRKRRGDR